MLVVASDPELGTLTDVLFLGCRRGRGVVHPDIEHMYPALVLAVIPSYIGQRPIGLQDDRDAVQLRVPGMKNVARHGLDRGAEEPIKRGGEVSGNRLRGTTFDLMAVDKMHHLSVAQQGDGWAAGLVLAEVLAGAGCGVQVLAGKDGNHLLRGNTMLERERQRRTGVPGSAAADGIYEHEHRTFLIADSG